MTTTSEKGQRWCINSYLCWFSISLYTYSEIRFENATFLLIGLRFYLSVVYAFWVFGRIMALWLGDKVYKSIFRYCEILVSFLLSSLFFYHDKWINSGTIDSSIWKLLLMFPCLNCLICFNFNEFYRMNSRRVFLLFIVNWFVRERIYCGHNFQ